MGTRIFQTTPVLQTRISQDRTGGVDSGEPPESDLGSERAAIPGRRAREEGVHRDDRGTQCTRVGLLSQVAASNELNFVSYRFPLPNTASYTLWDLYGPAFSCPFPVYRVGEHNSPTFRPTSLATFRCVQEQWAMVESGSAVLSVQRTIATA
jgi:hypothetical protein